MNDVPTRQSPKRTVRNRNCIGWGYQPARERPGAGFSPAPGGRCELAGHGKHGLGDDRPFLATPGTGGATLATRLTGLFTGPHVRRPLGVGGPAALRRHFPSLRLVKRRKSPILDPHRDSPSGTQRYACSQDGATEMPHLFRLDRTGSGLIQRVQQSPAHRKIRTTCGLLRRVSPVRAEPACPATRG